MITIDQHFIDDIKSEVNDLEEYAAWIAFPESCAGCDNNLRGDRCFLVDRGRPTECPWFWDEYCRWEIGHEKYLDDLTKLHAIITGQEVSMSGKIYKLTEVKND